MNLLHLGLLVLLRTRWKTHGFPKNQDLVTNHTCVVSYRAYRLSKHWKEAKNKGCLTLVFVLFWGCCFCSVFVLLGFLPSTRDRTDAGRAFHLLPKPAKLNASD